MNYDECPNCGSTNVEDNSEGITYPSEIAQGFECRECGASWEIVFAPIAIKNLEVPVAEDA